MNEGRYGIFFIHSSASPAGIVGTAKVCKEGPIQIIQVGISIGHYFDPKKSTQDSPRWFMVDVVFGWKVASILTLAELKKAWTGRCY